MCRESKHEIGNQLNGKVNKVPLHSREYFPPSVASFYMCLSVRSHKTQILTSRNGIQKPRSVKCNTFRLQCRDHIALQMERLLCVIHVWFGVFGPFEWFGELTLCQTYLSFTSASATDNLRRCIYAFVYICDAITLSMRAHLHSNKICAHVHGLFMQSFGNEQRAYRQLETIANIRLHGDIFTIQHPLPSIITIKQLIQQTVRETWEHVSWTKCWAIYYRLYFDGCNQTNAI